MDIKLTDEEILDTYPFGWLLEEIDDTDRNIAKAQIKKVYKWGNEECQHPPINGLTKRVCTKCWQELTK